MFATLTLQQEDICGNIIMDMQRQYFCPILLSNLYQTEEFECIKVFTEIYYVLFYLKKVFINYF